MHECPFSAQIDEKRSCWQLLYHNLILDGNTFLSLLIDDSTHIRHDFFLHRLSCVTRQVHLQHLSTVSFTHAEKCKNLWIFSLGTTQNIYYFLRFFKKTIESTYICSEKETNSSNVISISISITDVSLSNNENDLELAITLNFQIFNANAISHLVICTNPKMRLQITKCQSMLFPTLLHCIKN